MDFTKWKYDGRTTFGILLYEATSGLLSLSYEVWSPCTIPVSPLWANGGKQERVREIIMGPNVRTYLFHSLGGVIGPSFSVA